MRNILFALLLTVFATATPSPAPDPFPSQVPLFEVISLPISVPALSPEQNPFDVVALGTWLVATAPDGTNRTLRPFWTRDFARSQASNGSEILTPASDPYFAVRVAPDQLGTWTIAQLFAASPSPPPGVVPLNGSFVCVQEGSREGDGYAEVDTVHGQYFRLRTAEANRTAFWLVGENMAWPGVWPYFNGSSQFSNGTGGTYMYDRYMASLSKAGGGNWIRLWVGPSLVAEPVYDGEQGSFLDLSLVSGPIPFATYSLEAAWRIDYVVELARSLGVKITLVFDAQQAVCEPGIWCFWNQSAYNAANGGPLAQPSDIWTNAQTLAEFSQRWRYILARWAYSTSIFSWEIANEADDWAGWGPDAMAVHLSLAGMLNEEDPWSHMIDDSFANPSVAHPELEGNPLMAFTTAHAYSQPDYADAVWRLVTPRPSRWNKPAFMEEFGTTWQGPYEHALDPTGISVHNAAWASLVGLGAGTGMRWWWNEMDALGQYGQLAGAATLARNLSSSGVFLSHEWSTWSDCSGLGVPYAKAGWIVGVADNTTGCILLWAYNTNHTWQRANESAPVLPIEGASLTLHGLPLPPGQANVDVEWVNTTTGLPLPLPLPVARATGEREGFARVVGGSDLQITFPTFVTDVAAVVRVSAAGPAREPGLPRAGA
jgi:hypothetical protein